MEILGIDAATKKTGYSVLNSKTGELVEYGLIKTNSEDVRERISALRVEYQEKVEAGERELLESLEGEYFQKDFLADEPYEKMEFDLLLYDFECVSKNKYQ